MFNFYFCLKHFIFRPLKSLGEMWRCRSKELVPFLFSKFFTQQIIGLKFKDKQYNDIFQLNFFMKV